ncbi:LLM class flavin-dependent oxidoreductase [uncultured Rhodoblastus sp.]|uniref:LLM class flavin-dependent oxidoreductase n=1 Tax=uncultured Rhodoblastus sp. TaxID=543037 RepID=UPI0025ECFDBE|nr:LLM class flavin-dependent oxidoreductase [uncultured Rhodoblastus sp.]
MAMSLEFGLDTFGDVTLDPDGRPLPHAQILRDIVEEAVVADQVGVDFFGVGEHHRPDFAVSAPEVLLSAIAGQTNRIRLGSAATVLSSDDPVRVFQRFSTLNAVSNGRAEIIVGRGWFTESFPLFGYELSEYDALFEEKLGLLATLIRKEVVTWPGKKRSPLQNQRIFPPIENTRLKTWVAVGSTPNSVLRAARYDLPMIVAVIGGEALRFKPLFELYHRACERLDRPAREIGVHSSGYVADTDARAREEYWPEYKKFRDGIGTERGWAPIEKAQFETEIERGSLYVGSPETVARKIVTTVKALNTSRFEMKYSAGTLAHSRLKRSIELFGSQVVPLARELVG